MAKSITMTRDTGALQRFGLGTWWGKQCKSDGTDLGTPDDPQVLPIMGKAEIDDNWPTEGIKDADGHTYPVDGERLVKITLNIEQRDTSTLNFNTFAVGKFFTLIGQVNSDVTGKIDAKNQYVRFLICQVEKTKKISMKFGGLQVSFWVIDNPAADTGITANDATILAACVPAPLSTLVATDLPIAAHAQYIIADHT